MFRAFNKSGMFPESGDKGRLSVLESADFFAKLLPMGLQGGAAPIGHLRVPEEPPDTVLGIQVRGRIRAAFQPKGSARVFQQNFQSTASVSWRAIPTDQQPLVDRLSQMPQ